MNLKNVEFAIKIYSPFLRRQTCDKTAAMIKWRVPFGIEKKASNINKTLIIVLITFELNCVKSLKIYERWMIKCRKCVWLKKKTRKKNNAELIEYWRIHYQDGKILFLKETQKVINSCKGMNKKVQCGSCSKVASYFCLWWWKLKLQSEILLQISNFNGWF